MSHAFVKDGDEMWLRDIPPTLDALIYYLTRENSGIRVTEKENYFSEEHQAQVYRMSNGYSYVVKENKWVELE